MDLNGDSKMDKNDSYGYISSCSQNFLWAGGGHITAKDENNRPYVDFMNEKMLSIFDKAYEITNNEFTHSENEWFNETAIEMFQEGRGIFYSSQVIRVSDLREVEWDFGILPYPKYDSEQENYYSYVDGHASMICVPLVLENEEYSGMILEALSYESYKNILPIYYDVVLNTKLVRDENSANMLDIIRESKTFDFGYVYGNWNVTFMFQNMIFNKQTDLASSYAKNEKLENKTIEKIIEVYDELES